MLVSGRHRAVRKHASLTKIQQRLWNAHAPALVTLRYTSQADPVQPQCHQVQRFHSNPPSREQRATCSHRVPNSLVQQALELQGLVTVDRVPKPRPRSRLVSVPPHSILLCT